ncbi:UNVERIFIED_CONTAM: hypothetical protein FKN15_069974 [Acipenser sinensis]
MDRNALAELLEALDTRQEAQESRREERYIVFLDKGVLKIPGDTPQGGCGKVVWPHGALADPCQENQSANGEAVVVEQFCHVVDAETQAWIRCHNHDSLDKAVKLAED